MNKYPNPYASCQQVGKFELVSPENYKKIITNFWDKCREENQIIPSYTEYPDLKLPVRKTEDSAGYDFFLTQDVNLFSGQSIVIPTFIRCFIKHGWVLKLYPRSGLGFKYTMRLCNTVGIIDGDYYRSVTDGPDNEGHIMVKIVNEGRSSMHLKEGDRFCQGIFEMYGVTFSDDQDAKEERNGGIGSTGQV